jgi:hypothetical protein
MNKTAWMVAAWIGWAGLAFGQSLGAGRQSVDVWASVYGTNVAATLSNVFEQVAGRELAVGIDRGAWLVDEDLLVPSNVTLHVKRGSYFLLTNSATMTVRGEVAAGDYRVFCQAPSGGDCLVDASEGAFTLATSNWFCGGISWTGGFRGLADLWTAENLALLDANFTQLNDDFNVVDLNFRQVSNDFAAVAGTVNNHADLIRSNAVAHNLNWWYVLPNLFDQVFAGVDGWNRSAFEGSLWAANTNSQYLVPGSLGNYFSLTNWYFNRFGEVVQPWTHGVVAPMSNALDGIQFDAAYFLEWGYTEAPNDGTATTRTNVLATGIESNLFLRRDTAGGYISSSGNVQFSYPGTTDYTNPPSESVRGVMIAAPGRWHVSVVLNVCDITPIHSGTNAAREGATTFTLQFYDSSGNALGQWIDLGRLDPPSSGWVPLGLSESSPPVGYSSRIESHSTFLVTDVGGAPVDWSNFLEFRLRARNWGGQATNNVDAVHQVRSAAFTVWRSATWDVQ